MAGAKCKYGVPDGFALSFRNAFDPEVAIIECAIVGIGHLGIISQKGPFRRSLIENRLKMTIIGI
jgi:hypothetical protein